MGTSPRSMTTSLRSRSAASSVKAQVKKGLDHADSSKKSSLHQVSSVFQKLSGTYPVPEVFLDFSLLQRGAKRRERKALVTLDLNLTFMQTPGSGSDPRARIG